MNPKQVATFRLDDDLLWGLRLVHARDGVAPSEQARRAIEAWLEDHLASQRHIHRAFDDFEDSMTAAYNRHDGSSLADVKLPKAFGPKLAGRMLGTLSLKEMETIDVVAAAAGRRTRAHRDFWQRAVKQRQQPKRNTA